MRRQRWASWTDHREPGPHLTRPNIVDAKPNARTRLRVFAGAVLTRSLAGVPCGIRLETCQPREQEREWVLGLLWKIGAVGALTASARLGGGRSERGRGTRNPWGASGPEWGPGHGSEGGPHSPPCSTLLPPSHQLPLPTLGPSLLPQSLYLFKPGLHLIAPAPLSSPKPGPTLRMVSPPGPPKAP